LRDVQDLLAERGLIVSHESIRQWCDTFGPTFAAGLRKRRARPGDKWHCDEMLLKINGKRYWLWRAVDQEGIVLDMLVQERRDQAAAEAFLRRVLASCEGTAPRVIVTDKLASYVPAIKRVLPIAEHRRHKGVNNRAENSHLPVRKRERTLQRFKSKGACAALPGTVQRSGEWLSSATTSALCQRVSAGPSRAIPPLARGDPGRRAPLNRG
jgi:putative transposase